MPATFTPPAPDDVVKERFIPPSPSDVIEQRFIPPKPEERLPSDPYAGAAEEMVRPVTDKLPAVTDDAAEALALMKYAEDTQPGRWRKQPQTVGEWTRFMLGGAFSPIKQTESAVESALIAVGAAKPGDRLLYRPSEALERHYGDKTLPRVAPKEGLPGQVAGGVANAAIGLADFLMTPEGTLSLGIGMVPKTLKKVILTIFAGKMATEAPEQFRKAYEAAKSGDTQGAVEHVTSGTGGVAFSALLAKHGAFPEAPKPSGLTAESFKEPQERSIPVESVQESATPKTDQAVESVTEAKGPVLPTALFGGGTSLGKTLRQKLPEEVKPAFDALPNEIQDNHGIARTSRVSGLVASEDAGYRYDQRRDALLIDKEMAIDGEALQNETIASWAFNHAKAEQSLYESWRKAAFPKGQLNKEGFSGFDQADSFARSVMRWIKGEASPEITKVLDDRFNPQATKGPVLQPPAPTPTAVVSESGTVPVSAGNIPPARATLPLEEAQDRPTQGVSTTDAGAQASGKLLIDPYSTPMLERLASIGGPVSKQVAREARQIDADALGLIGQISQTLDTARQLAGKAFRGGTTWIRGKENVTPNAAIARLHTLEGTDRAAVVASAPAKAQEMVGAIWDANVPAIGGMAQRANVGFAPTGKIQRILTSPGMDIVLSGGGKLWNRLVEGTATSNGKTVADTAAFFREWKAILDDPSPDMAKIDKIAQDYVRQFPKAITHVKSGPSWIEVLVSDPVDYLKLASERTARAVAFRQVYPNTEAGRQLLVATHKAVLAELPTQIRREEFNNLMKSLQGHRLDFGPEKFLGAVPWAQVAAETVGTVTRPLKSAMLSLSSLANAAETVIGGPAIFLRFRNVVPLLLKNPVRFYKQLEMAGTVDRATRNFAFNPTAPLRSVSRMVSEGVGRVTLNNFFNEVQEFTSSGAGRVLADRVRNNDLSAGEIKDFESVLRAMGFRENFREIARGTDLAGLDQFEKQAANFLSAGHQRPATSSRLANSRAFNSLMWFHRYPQMVVNQFRGIANNLVEDVRTGNKSHMYRDSKLMARFIGGKALQGVLMQLFVTGVKEGVQGIDQKQREAREALASFLLQATANAVGGPLTLATRIGERAESGEDVAEELVKTSPPVSTGIDLYNAVAGKGRYAGLDTFNTASQFLQSKTPAIPAIRSAMGVVGLAQDNPKLRTAIGGYYRWARKQGYKWPDGQPKDAEFTATMRKVTREMERGGDWQEQLLKAVDVKVEKGEDPAKSIKASLGARKILKNQHGAALNAEETDSLRHWLGEDNFQLLQERDAMVDAVADSF